MATSSDILDDLKRISREMRLGALPASLPVLVQPDPVPSQYRFPRSKRRRIRRKLAKRPKNWTFVDNAVADDVVLRVGDRLVVNPRMFSRMKQELPAGAQPWNSWPRGECGLGVSPAGVMLGGTVCP